jgi:hypothetical protein
MPLARRVLRIALLVAVTLVGGCAGTAPPTPSPSPLPAPTCGGLRVAIRDALPCDAVVARALAALAERAPDQLARGVIRIDVLLAECPRGEMPPQIDCGSEPFAQLVTVDLGPSGPGGPSEPSLTVAIAPVTGRLLGIQNPLIR